jgi:hypothetical protein
VSRTAFRLSLLIALIEAGPMPRTALAGAWLAPEGHGQIVVTGTASSASKAFDSSGDLQSTPRYTKTELQALMEYGVTDWLTTIAMPSLQHVDIAAPIDAQRTGLGNSEFGARARVMQDANWVLSAQGTVRVPGTGDTNNPAAVGYTGFDFDLRALYGVSFALGGLPAFADIQLAQRFRTGGPPDEARLDLTLGVRAARQWLLLLQQFNVISEGSGRAPFTSNNYHKLQFSVVYDVTPRWSVQGGAFTTFAGRNALQENGVLTGVWYRF